MLLKLCQLIPFLTFQMGNSKKQSNDFQEWAQLYKLPDRIIYRHNESQLLAAAVQLTYSSLQQMESELKLFQFRNSIPNAVRIFTNSQKQEVKKKAMGQQYYIMIMVEVLPKLLKQQKNLDFHKSLLYLQAAVCGFSVLAKVYQRQFIVNDSMVGTSTDGSIRIWLNQDFSKNIAQQSSYQSYFPQKKLIQSIFSMVQKHCPRQSLPSQISFLQRSQLIDNFQTCLRGIRNLMQENGSQTLSLNGPLSYRSR